VDTESSTFRPPYMSFQTFWNFIEELASKPLPPRVDRSLMQSKSGTDQANLTMALTSFGLTDSEGNVLSDLTELVAKTAEERKKSFAEMVDLYYEGPMRVSKENGTTAALNAAFVSDYPSIASADTRRKALTFFLHAARESGIELSPHFPQTRSGSGAPGAPKQKRTTPRKPKNHDGESASTGKNTTDQKPPSGHTNTVTLKSGGTVTLTYDVNLFDLDEDDESFVMGLVKKLRGYSNGTTGTKAKQHSAAGETVGGDDA
jgi:hypothetical protein